MFNMLFIKDDLKNCMDKVWLVNSYLRYIACILCYTVGKKHVLSFRKKKIPLQICTTQ
jgi:hypothetical protein